MEESGKLALSGCLVIHVFTEEARQFYDLERLWADAEKIDLGEIITPDGV